MPNKDHLEVVERTDDFVIQWFVADEEDFGAFLGEDPCGDDEMLAANKAARPFACNASESGKDVILSFENEATANKALRAANAAMKALHGKTKSTVQKASKPKQPETASLSFDLFYDAFGNRTCGKIVTNSRKKRCFFANGFSSLCSHTRQKLKPSKTDLSQFAPCSKCPFSRP
jgi:hypothetical protein